MIQFRRRKEQKTNYKKRLAMLRSGLPRVVIRKSLYSISLSVVKYNPKGDETVLGLTSKALKKYGYTGACDTTPAGYLVGLLAGVKMKKQGIKEAVADIGLSSSTKGNCLYAVIKGLNEAGVKVNADEEMFPDDNRVKGGHMARKPNFDETKQKILGER